MGFESKNSTRNLELTQSRFILKFLRYHNPDGSSCPTEKWCPFNWYRTSGDINNGLMSWFDNLQTTIKFQDKDHPLSVPSCWAYPDMMEIGRIKGGNVTWSRAHFGAWCVVSAPLIIGMDITDTKTLSTVIPYLLNPEAIAVNQNWAGHPGRLVSTLASIQVWVKPMPKEVSVWKVDKCFNETICSLAVYVVNPTQKNSGMSIPIDELGLGVDVKIAGLRDIWERKDLNDITDGKLTVGVSPMDSTFLLLTAK